MVIVDVIFVVVTGAEPETGMDTGVDPTTPELDPGDGPFDDEAGGRETLGANEDDPGGSETLADEPGKAEEEET